MDKSHLHLPLLTNVLCMQLARMLRGNKILMTPFGASCPVYRPCYSICEKNIADSAQADIKQFLSSNFVNNKRSFNAVIQAFLVFFLPFPK